MRCRRCGFRALRRIAAPLATHSRGFEAPGDAAARELIAWGEARGIKIGIGELSAVPGASPVDPSIADAVEKELTASRDALTRLDADKAEDALVRARALLRAHPELPQAAWLLAEVERGWSARYMRISPTDPDRAARAWQRAAELDGGRAAGIGETDHPEGRRTLRSPFQPTAIAISRCSIDGTDVPLGTIDAPPGEHAVVTMRRGRVLWANWVSFADHEDRARAFVSSRRLQHRRSRRRASRKKIDSRERCFVRGVDRCRALERESSIRVALCAGE